MLYKLRGIWLSFLSQVTVYPSIEKKNSQVSSFSFKELEESIRTKEKELESIEQSGLSLIQNKKEEACSAVLNTLQEINHSWANLDHMVK